MRTSFILLVLLWIAIIFVCFFCFKSSNLIFDPVAFYENQKWFERSIGFWSGIAIALIVSFVNEIIQVRKGD